MRKQVKTAKVNKLNKLVKVLLVSTLTLVCYLIDFPQNNPKATLNNLQKVAFADELLRGDALKDEYRRVQGQLALVTDEASNRAKEASYFFSNLGTTGRINNLFSSIYLANNACVSLEDKLYDSRGSQLTEDEIKIFNENLNVIKLHIQALSDNITYMPKVTQKTFNFNGSLDTSNKWHPQYNFNRDNNDYSDDPAFRNVLIHYNGEISGSSTIVHDPLKVTKVVWSNLDDLKRKTGYTIQEITPLENEGKKRSLSTGISNFSTNGSELVKNQWADRATFSMGPNIFETNVNLGFTLTTDFGYGRLYKYSNATVNGNVTIHATRPSNEGPTGVVLTKIFTDRAFADDSFIGGSVQNNSFNPNVYDEATANTTITENVLNSKYKSESGYKFYIRGWDKEDQAMNAKTKIEVVENNYPYTRQDNGNDGGFTMTIPPLTTPLPNGTANYVLKVTDSDGASNEFTLQLSLPLEKNYNYVDPIMGVEGSSVDARVMVIENGQIVKLTNPSSSSSLGYVPVNAMGLSFTPSDSLDASYRLTGTLGIITPFNTKKFEAWDENNSEDKSRTVPFRVIPYPDQSIGFNSNATIYRKLKATVVKERITMKDSESISDEAIVQANLSGTTFVAEQSGDTVYGLNISDDGKLFGTPQNLTWKPGEKSKTVIFTIKAYGDLSTYNQEVNADKTVKVTVVPSTLVASLDNLEAISGQPVEAKVINVVDPTNVRATKVAGTGLKGIDVDEKLRVSGTPIIDDWNDGEAKREIPLSFNLENSVQKLTGKVDAKIIVYRPLTVNTSDATLQDGASISQQVVTPNVTGATIQATPSGNSYGLNIDHTGKLVGTANVDDWPTDENQTTKTVTFNVVVKGLKNQSQAATVNVTIRKNLDKDGDYIPDVDDTNPTEPVKMSWGITRVPNALNFQPMLIDFTKSSYTSSLIKEIPKSQTLQVVDRTNSGSWSVRTKFELRNARGDLLLGSKITAKASLDVFNVDRYKTRNLQSTQIFDGTEKNLMRGNMKQSATLRFSKFSLSVPQNDSSRPIAGEATGQIEWHMIKAP